jgi:Predicted AAA-ATPase/PD-(D/E)XK nuclease superfamily
MKKLPISIQTFQNIRGGNFIYVDKTNFVYDIAQEIGSFFLSRPRRFGKSLLLNTLKSLFEGKKELFEGLWIYDKWDWSKTSPVLHFSFDKTDNKILEKSILSELKNYAEKFEVDLTEEGIKNRFQELLRKIYKQHGAVIVLIDEYDKPIIEFLEFEEDGIYTQAIENQKIMKQFYSVLKSAEEYLRLTFITGVSKFTKVSIFSDLNHLNDITLNKKFANIVGYTQAELENNFEEYIEEVQNELEMERNALLDKIKLWYNGFSWNGEATLYNPFGILNFFSKQNFQNFWFSTGTPTFLLNQMKKQNLYDVENTNIDIESIESYDINNLALIPLLFQTGYLTIKEMDGRELVLDYPNQEVRESMYRFMIDGLAPSSQRIYTLGTMQELKKAFLVADLTTVRSIISALLADLPSEVFDKKSEGLYHGLLHFIFRLLGIYIKSEVHSSKGRADSVVETATHIYIFEFKFNRNAAEALQQIKDKNYAAKYQNAGKTIVGIGVNFKTDEKEINGWEVENL